MFFQASAAMSSRYCKRVLTRVSIRSIRLGAGRWGARDGKATMILEAGTRANVQSHRATLELFGAWRCALAHYLVWVEHTLHVSPGLFVSRKYSKESASCCCNRRAHRNRFGCMWRHATHCKAECFYAACSISEHGSRTKRHLLLVSPDPRPHRHLRKL